MAKTFSKAEILATIHAAQARLANVDELSNPDTVRHALQWCAVNLGLLVNKRNKWAVQKCVHCGKEQWGRELHPFCSPECSAAHAKEMAEEAKARG